MVVKHPRLIFSIVFLLLFIIGNPLMANFSLGVDRETLIQETIAFVKKTQGKDPSGHDADHSLRVWKMAKKIAQNETVDELVVEVAALLHDIADWKFHEGDCSAGSKKAALFLSQFSVDDRFIEHVGHIIENISFKGAKTNQVPLSKEGQIVQDADRLDALGAIGIARAFAYGGYKHTPLYDVEDSLQHHDSFASYQKKKGATINHFYEKLLLLKDRMNSQMGRQIAEERHQWMLNFLDQFFTETELSPTSFNGLRKN